MELKEYGKLREKINSKDFEGKNKKLDKWLYYATFLGNGISIFFAFFLLYPALKSSFLLNVNNENLSIVFAGFFTVVFLVIFEVVKRYLIRNFSFDNIWRKHSINEEENKGRSVATKTFVWFMLMLIVIATSFYLSLSGAKNFASGFDEEREIQRVEINQEIDTLEKNYEERIKPYMEENRRLSEINIGYRERMGDLPDNYLTARREFQQFIRENEEIIRENREIINNLNNELNNHIQNLEERHEERIKEVRDDDFNTIFLFIIIVVLNESLIVLGLYFREYYEHMLFILNQNKYEPFYRKRKHYKKLLKYLYGGGGMEPGVSVPDDLIDLINRRTKIRNPHHFVEEFYRDMERLGVVTKRRKRDPRYFKLSYDEAMERLESVDDDVIILDDFK